MNRVLLLITDDGATVTVDVDYSPPPGEEPTPAQRLTASLIEHLQAQYGATVVTEQPNG